MQEQEMIRIDSVSTWHKLSNLPSPKHPLITLVNYSELKEYQKWEGVTFISDLYLIMMKEVSSACSLRYGRMNYDYQGKSMLFLAPGQKVTVNYNEEAPNGWGLSFHPDLIRKSNLATAMKDYTFFSYDTHEALHVSDREKETITHIVQDIENEFSANLDEHSQTLILSQLELLLNYCKRFYSRQFITRENHNKDVLTRFDGILHEYFVSGKVTQVGLPTAKYLADAMPYSTNYLNDLLKKETGKTTLEHIHSYVIEEAKILLLSSNNSVVEISQKLGFEYTQNFSRLFKKKTGMSPNEYRKVS
ncbi:MAG: helix-turn-helix transcriptional regulator [Spirochaetota bacterium]